jgi:hypothetical protein
MLIAIPGFEEKTGISLTLSQVQLAIRQRAQNFHQSVFARLEGKLNRHFWVVFGTNWDKSTEILER